MLLIPGTRVTQIDPSTVEVRLGSRPPLHFFDLSPDQCEWLLALVGPPRRQSTSRVAGQPGPIVGQAGQRLEVHPTIVASLKKAGLVLPGHRRARPRTELLGVLSAESFSLMCHELDGPRIVQNRTNSIVAVQGISRTTFAALTALAAGGIRYFVVDDPRPWDRMEFAHEGLESTTAGTREVAVRDYFARNLPRCIVLSTHTAVDAVIVNCEEMTNPLTAAGLHAQGIPHVMVTGVAAHIELGPFVIPGETGCCNCVLLSRTTAAERQNFAAFSDRITRAATQGMAQPAAQSAAAARVAGGIVAGQVLMFLDGLVPDLTQNLVVVDNLGPVPRSTPWQSHTQCMCTAVSIVEQVRA